MSADGSANTGKGLRRALLIAAAALAGSCSRDAEVRETPPVDGELAYTVRCSYCHDVPNGIGAVITPRVLAAYGTVGRLDRYLRTAMPHETPGSLADAEYDAILRYMIESRGLLTGASGDWPAPDTTKLRVP